MSGGMIAWLEDSLVEDGHLTADQWEDFQNTMCETAQAWFEDNKPKRVMPRWNPEPGKV
jgi:polyhydroxyalkanoate synthesis regulator phasin